MTIIEIGKMNDGQAREYLEGIRWPNGPVCPHCDSQNVTRLQGEAHRPGTIQCNEKACRKQFTFTVNSVMESSHIPLVKWAMAFHMICSSKKGMSALQLQRNLGLGSYKTAWFMAHRIRAAMQGSPIKAPLKGIVEADESYFGGRPKPGTVKRGRGTTKQAVMVLVERDGAAISVPLGHVSGVTLRNELKAHVSRESLLMTDEFACYRRPGKMFAEHDTVNHSAKEYARVRGDGIVAHTNTAESFFALMKRGFHGIYHQWSKKHTHRYCSEFAFRWSYRKVTDTERTEAAIKHAEGWRLMYSSPDTRHAG